MSRTLLLLAFLALALGCASPSEGPKAGSPETPDVVFTCADGSQFVVDLREDELELRGGQEPVVLQRQISASGAKYGDGSNLFWEHRGEAAIVLNGESYERCEAE